MPLLRMHACAKGAYQYARATVWVRDLTEEGIEPNPGPRVCSKNIDGISNPETFNSTMYKIAREHERDPILAVMLQEHHITKDKHAEMRCAEVAKTHDLLYVQAHRPAASGKGGAAIVIPMSSIERKDAKEDHATAIKRVADSMKQDPSGEWITIDTLIDGKAATLASAYAPPDSRADERPEFFEELAQDINDHTILGIDANCVPDERIDLQRNGSTPYNNTGAEEMALAAALHDLTDVTRETLGDETPFFTNSTRLQDDSVTKTRIDQVYTPAIDAIIFKLNPSATDFLRKPGTTYGHSMIQVTAEIIRPKRGQDLRNISEAIFDDATFNSKLAALIGKTQWEARQAGDSWRSTWEKVKTAVRDECLKRTGEQRKKRNDEARAMLKHLAHLEARIRGGTANTAEYSERDEMQRKLQEETKRYKSLNDMLDQEAYEKGKKHDVSSAAFFRQWTPRNAAQWIAELMVRDWTDPSNPTRIDGRPDTQADSAKIAEALTEYYRPLYANKPVVPESKRKALDTLRNGKKVLAPTAAKCDADVSKDEVLHTCAYLPLGKSPGSDRIPNKFYRVFSATISEMLAAVINESRAAGELPQSMREGIISVLYKKGERSDPRNYRPITLLNNDYKIMMRILTQRMNEAVVQFVSRDQNGFVPDAFIAENIVRLKLLQDMIDEEDIDALFVFLDMEKAFDRCSWEFLIEGMQELGFGSDFIDYIKLAYSAEHPPERKLYVNGHLGPSFPLGSGVAQGCPISPLLFLVIAEPLTRLINNDRKIWGVSTKSRGRRIRHKISQFADDSTLILRLADVERAMAKLQVWCEATSMKENDTKREVLLLGALRRPSRRGGIHKHNSVTPDIDRRDHLPECIARDTIIDEGKEIRALGVPMGDNLDEEQWWLKRYRVVKARVGRWNGLAKASLTGRNMLLQAILYGSLRYWFFTLTVPERIITIVEQDAKQLLWAANPELHTDEEGTAKKSRRYIAHVASLLPQKKGGGGIMHLESHIKAFQAQWIIKYLDPRDSPWKDVLDHWILGNGTRTDDTRLGRGVILTPRGLKRAERLPAASTYMRACFEAFADLGVQQDLTIITHATQGEPLWRNNRFTVRGVHDQETWEYDLATYRLSDLLSPDGFYSTDEWSEWFTQLMPQELNGKRIRQDEWRDERERDLPIIKMSVPKPVRDALAKPTGAHAEGEIILVTSSATGEEAYVRHHTDGTLDELWLDTSGYPHATGNTLLLSDQQDSTKVALWTGLNKHYRLPYAGDNDDTPEERSSIIGPTTRAFPLNDGWHPNDTPARKARDQPKRLSDLTIHEMTVIFTERITKDVRPNCEAKWQLKLPHIRADWPSVWPKVWSSLGTPLSDPTEERAWRRLLHRAIDARNRHPHGDHSCRLLCGCTNESMLHMVRCPWVAQLWQACFKFATGVLKVAPRTLETERAIIFNMGTDNKPLPLATRALLRHAVRWWYADLTHINQTPGSHLMWEHTFCRTLEGLRDATLRHARAIRLHYIHRAHTNLQGIVSESERAKFGQLVTIHLDGTYELTAAFSNAVKAAQDELERRRTPPGAQPANAPAGRP